MRSSVVFSVFIAAAIARTAYVCNVQLPGYPDSLTEPTISFGGQSLRFVDTYNAISFGNFYAPSGDVEGRAAVRDNVDVTAYSFGDKLITAGANAFSQYSLYSLVAGGNVNYAGGALYPLGTGASQKEFMYIGGGFTGANYLSNDNLFAQNSGNKDAAFDNAESYYQGLSTAFAAVGNNAQFTVQYSGATLTCNSLAATTYFVSTTVAQFSTITYYTIDASCNTNAKLVINVAGTGNAKFSGDNIHGWDEHNILFNFPNAAGIRVETEIRGSILAPVANYVQPGMGVVYGIVIVNNMQQVHQINILRHCVPPVEEPAPVFPCPAWEGTCSGFDLTLNGATYSFKDFNAISFGNFVAASGDVEGRLAVRNNAQLATYSVGHQLQTSINDRSLPFALVVGGELTFTSGAVFPAGDGIPYPGTQENIAAGSVAASTADYLAAQVTAISGVQSQFDGARGCYSAISNNIALNSDNVDKTITESGAFISCRDSAATIYIASFTPAEMAQFTYYVVSSNCNAGASWYINIRGQGDVTFTGDSFPAIPGGVVYNVLGARTVNVNAVALNGHLLAPDATLNQVGGVILGKVVVGDVIASLQINRENTCVNVVTYAAPVVAGDPAPAGFPVASADPAPAANPNANKRSGEFCSSFVNPLSVGDVIYDGPTADASVVGKVVSADGNNACIATAGSKRSVERLANYQVYGYLQVNSMATNNNGASAAENMDSSASAVAFSAAAMIIAALVL